MCYQLERKGTYLNSQVYLAVARGEEKVKAKIVGACRPHISVTAFICSHCQGNSL